jgi:large subunit GTPase 1
VVVISAGALPPVDLARAVAARAEVESRNRHRLCIPRRPAWTAATTPEKLEEMERASFLAWRRDLAALEGDERLVLTPFEKNLEVWRQLWRVVERSDAVVQVVDARDPLTYRSEDLESYCAEAAPGKRCLMLLNKADLLPQGLRSAWADYFDGEGVRYAFWSAKAAAAEADGSGPPPERCDDPRARLLSVPQLLALLEAQAAGAAADAEALGAPRASRSGRCIVGLTGYPNVGKSSTINALFGSKKTAVAATPGKTKHFQTLFVSDSLCLCDCPGLVMPQFAHSKAEMVAAGVIPIDRLTDVRAPVATVAERVSRAQLESVYGLRLPPPAADEDPDRPPTPAELLRALAASRGWGASSGLPDETRAGRRLLKDYVDGKVLSCKPPPGAPEEVVALAEAVGGRRSAALTAAAAARLQLEPGAGAAAPPAAQPEQRRAPGSEGDGSYTSDDGGEDASSSSGSEFEEEEEEEGGAGAGAGAGPAAEALVLDAADLDLLQAMQAPAVGKKQRPTRPEHKFHKKRQSGKQRLQTGDPGLVLDGAPLPHGKRGGLVRVPV